MDALEDPDKRKEDQEALEITLRSIQNDENIESIWGKIRESLDQVTSNIVGSKK